MIVYVLIIVVFAVILPDLYIWNSFIRGGSSFLSIVYWLPLILILATVIISFAGYWQNFLFRAFIFLLLSTVIPKCVFTVLSLAGRGGSYLFPKVATLGNQAGIIAALILFAFVVYGFAEGWKRLEVKETSVASSDIPMSFDGYKIVQLSDFHIGTYESSPKMVDEIVEKVNGLHPDVIVFTGDLVNTSPDEVYPFVEVLSRMKAKDGVYSVLGNHDYCEYRQYTAPDSPQKSLAKLIEKECMMGWKLLINEHRLLYRDGDSIAVIGVENDGEPPFPSRANLTKAMAGLPNNLFKILLSHDPSHWRRSVLPDTDIQLTLSGHTHAMQLKVGNFSPAKWKYSEWGGVYQENGRTLHVSTGVGSNVAFRLGAWPEINIIKLHSTKK